MNPLQDVLDAGDGELNLDEVREATAASLQALRHDRRLERLGFDQVHELSIRLFQTPDIRTLAKYRSPLPAGSAKEDIDLQQGYVNQMLFEVVDDESMQHPTIRQLQRIAVSRGGLMRIAPVPFRLHIYNRQFALIAADYYDSGAGAIAVLEPDLIASLASLHARLWQEGQKWGGAGSGVDLADVLGELLAGSTDEASAERLHVSLRTYRRKVRELLDLLGVQSRFQAGAVANERRYLDLVRPENRPVAATSNPYEEALDAVRSSAS